MGKRIKSSERDQRTLERLRQASSRTIKTFEQPADYRNTVVLKPWGYEFLAFQNEHVAIWFLHLGEGHSTSMHCHPNKQTSLILMKGEVQCNFFGQRAHLKPVSSVSIDRGVFHSTKALLSGGAFLIEVESPPDKTDLVRLKDEYDRQSFGYEGIAEMRTEGLDEFDYFWMDEPGNAATHRVGNCCIDIVYVSGQEAMKSFQWSDSAYYCCCRGELLDSGDKKVLCIGNIEKGSDLRQFDSLVSHEDLVLMRFQVE